MAPKGSNFEFFSGQNPREVVADVKALKKAIWDMVRLPRRPASSGYGGSRCLVKWLASEKMGIWQIWKSVFGRFLIAIVGTIFDPKWRGKPRHLGQKMT